MPLLGKWFANEEWRMYFQIHLCLSTPLGEHLSNYHGTAMCGRARHTQSSQAQQSVTFAVLEHCLHRAFPVCGPPDSSWSSNFVFHRPPALPQVHFMVIVNKEQCYKDKKQQTHLLVLWILQTNSALHVRQHQNRIISMLTNPFCYSSSWTSAEPRFSDINKVFL